MKKHILFVIVLLCLLIIFGGCSGRAGSSQETTPTDAGESSDIRPELTGLQLSHDDKFGGIYLMLSTQDFNAAGFELGDSVDVIFSTGYELHDLPYFNGYYVDAGQPLVLGYPGHDHMKVGINYGDDLWILAGIEDNSTADVVLNERGKYLEDQIACDIHYSDEQGDESDVVFANFRNVRVGSLGENVLFRSASPIDNKHNRAAVADRLISGAGVNFVIDLSDDDEEIKAHIAADDFNSPYFRSLYESGRVVPLAMSMQFKSEEFAAKVVEGLNAMSENDGPYLVHCVEGKDRTGFFCMLLEGLAGASYDEIIDDYMLTYDNYYGVNEQDDKERYDIIKARNIDSMLSFIAGEESGIVNADLSAVTEKYLISIGMSEESIQALKDRLTKNV